VITDIGSVELFVAAGRVSVTELVVPSATPWATTPF